MTYIYILEQENEICLPNYDFIIKSYFTYLFWKKPLNRNLFPKTHYGGNYIHMN